MPYNIPKLPKSTPAEARDEAVGAVIVFAFVCVGVAGLLWMLAYG